MILIITSFFRIYTSCIFDQQIEIISFMPSYYNIFIWYKQYIKFIPIIITINIII